MRSVSTTGSVSGASVRSGRKSTACTAHPSSAPVAMSTARCRLMNKAETATRPVHRIKLYRAGALCKFRRAHNAQ
jgi:hypothetical protein